MNAKQLRVAASILDTVADDLSSRVCNDFVLPNTEDNLQFVKDMIAASDYPEDVPNISKNGKKIYLLDWQVARYLADLFRKCTDEPVLGCGCGAVCECVE